MTEMIDVHVLRVFTDRDGNHGNLLGIVTSSARSRGREQAIAARLGFSETVFVDAIVHGTAKVATAQLRIFTPTQELPFAGHPSVGTAWWLAREGTPVSVLHEPAGDVLVDLDGETTWIAAPAEWAPEFTWLELATPAEVDALDSGQFTDGNHYAYAWVDEEAGELRSRMFAPGMGIVEDEATGAAAVRVTARLGRDLSIRQGAGSEVFTTRTADGRVRVGGRTLFERILTIEP